MKKVFLLMTVALLVSAGATAQDQLKDPDKDQLRGRDRDQLHTKISQKPASATGSAMKQAGAAGARSAKAPATSVRKARVGTPSGTGKGR